MDEDWNVVGPPAERIDADRIAAFEREIQAVAKRLGFQVVHFTPIGRPQRAGYMPWISAHFEQLPAKRAE